MRPITGPAVRRTIHCGLVAVTLAACGRGESPAGGETAQPGAMNPSSTSASTPASTPAPAPTTATAAGSVESGVRIAVAQKPATGSYLTDGTGRSVYLFLKDAADSSSCYDACAAAWPPVVVAGAPATSDSAVQASLVGTSKRHDGTTQATYKGAPLYFYEDDKKPGDVTGQGKLEFGARWYLVSPAGGKQEGSKAGRKGAS
jgi:predicted lipoprotein with Yx(FWY)xxD motif